METPLPLSLTLIIIFLVVIVAIAERLNQLITDDQELTRKVVHIGAGNVILLAWWLNIPGWVGVGAAIITGTIALTSYFIPILPSINSVGRKSLGTLFYAISFGVLVAWFWSEHLPQYAVIGILVMAWGDGMAAIIGQRYGKHPYQVLGMTKSWEGSGTMAIVSHFISCLILLPGAENIWHSWLICLIVAVVAASLETISKLGVDNLTVPIGSAAIAFYLSQLCDAPFSPL